MKYKLKNGVSMETIEEHRILVTEAGDTAMLNDLAGEIICGGVDGRDISGIIDEIAAEYTDTDRNVIKTDAEDFLFELSEKAFLELY